MKLIGDRKSLPGVAALLFTDQGGRPRHQILDVASIGERGGFYLRAALSDSPESPWPFVSFVGGFAKEWVIIGALRHGIERNRRSSNYSRKGSGPSREHEAEYFGNGSVSYGIQRHYHRRDVARLKWQHDSSRVAYSKRYAAIEDAKDRREVGRGIHTPRESINHRGFWRGPTLKRKCVSKA